MNNTEQTVRKELFAMSDDGYRSFQAGLMPTIPPDSVIGVRIPLLRRYAKGFAKADRSAEFLSALPHKFYDENNLHAFLIEQISDVSLAFSETERFLPYVDNWATCDMFSPKIFGKHKPELLEYIRKWVTSNHVYTARFGVNMLMSHFLDDDFTPEIIDLALTPRRDDYYMMMSVAWFLSVALVKQYDGTVGLIESKTLDKRTQNKTISKACDSYRLSDTTKKHLKSFRI